MSPPASTRTGTSSRRGSICPIPRPGGWTPCRSCGASSTCATRPCPPATHRRSGSPNSAGSPTHRSPTTVLAHRSSSSKRWNTSSERSSEPVPRRTGPSCRSSRTTSNACARRRWRSPTRRWSCSTRCGPDGSRVLGTIFGRWVLAGAIDRAELGTIEFHDLLVLARRLVARHPDVRDYLHQRYQRILLDEFQDTDPIQLEIAVRLAADPHDPLQDGDWTGLRPLPGHLFIVGDPKQSIYRFRRADIAQYLRAADQIGADREYSPPTSARRARCSTGSTACSPR